MNLLPLPPLPLELDARALVVFLCFECRSRKGNYVRSRALSHPPASPTRLGQGVGVVGRALPVFFFFDVVDTFFQAVSELLSRRSLKYVL